jgi:nickel/cobalt transporter (NicO) family protein
MAKAPAPGTSASGSADESQSTIDAPAADRYINFGSGGAPGHARDHEHHHGPQPGERMSWMSLLALGVSGGLLPGPEALMVLLITIAAHRVLFGLLLIVAFSTGLTAVPVGFGLRLVYARGLFAGVNLSSGLASSLLPVASALVIVVAGSVITAQALPQVL